MQLALFTSSSCMGCRISHPSWEKFKKDHPNIPCVEFSEDAPEVETYDVTSAPTVILLDGNKKEISRFSGVFNADILVNLWSKGNK